VVCRLPQNSNEQAMRFQIRGRAADNLAALPGAIQGQMGAGLTGQAPVVPDERFFTDGENSAVARHAISLPICVTGVS
jgi:hypothetical protein